MLKHKKWYIVVALITLVLLLSCFFYTKKDSNSNNLENIVLNEVVHSAFYAPQYIALANGYFEDEGLNVELVTGNGADKSMTSLLTGDSHIILAGAESSMYLESDEDSVDIINIAQLTKRAGNFLVAKENTENFKWEDVIGKNIIGGRPGGMPEIILENILNEKGITPFEDVNIVTNIDFTATTSAFATGDYDYTVEFEPNATKLEEGGLGVVVASLGVESGEIPYTSYITTKDFAENNEETILKFLRAIKKAQIYMVENSVEDVVECINPYFETIDVDQLAKVIERYKAQDTWNTDLFCNKESYEKLMKILIDAGTLDSEIDIDKIIDNSYLNKISGE